MPHEKFSICKEFLAVKVFRLDFRNFKIISGGFSDE